jgi:hypothetical protein
MGSQQRSISYILYILLLIYEVYEFITDSGACYSKCSHITEYIVFQTYFFPKSFIKENMNVKSALRP